MKNLAVIAILLALLICLGRCAPIGIGLYYKKAALPESQIVRNIQYSHLPDRDPILNRLDLYLPEGKDWPVMVFVHGGGWNQGDKDLKVAGADVYGNIGRYFASQGIGVAVISYRLLPHVDWKTQVLDVAMATGWVYHHIDEYQGNPKNIFLVGHSAGAQIASRVSLDSSALNVMGLSPRLVCGVIPISGVGYNFLNEETYQMGKDADIYKTLFNTEDLSRIMRKRLSPIFFAKRTSPPFLILYAARDQKEVRHASQGLSKWLIKVGAKSQVYMIPKESHKSEILALSRAKTPAALVTVFIKTMDCAEK